MHAWSSAAQRRIARSGCPPSSACAHGLSSQRCSRQDWCRRGSRRAFQAGSPGEADLRAAIARRIQSARSVRELQELLDRYGSALSPREIQQLVSAAPVMRVRPPPSRPHAPPAAPPGVRPPPAPPSITAPPRAPREQRQLRGLMERLARSLTEQDLEGCDCTALADTAHALAHAGALDEAVARRLLEHTSAQAAAGKLSVQGLADILSALGAARFRPSPAAMQQLLADVDPLSRCHSTQELSALLQGLSRLGYKPDDSFVAAVVDQLQRREAAKARAPGVAAPAGPLPASSGLPPPGQTVNEDQEVGDDDQEAAREREEAHNVAAAVQALRRMGHARQAAQLQATYLRELQARAAARLQAREAARREKAVAAAREAARQREEAAAAAAERVRREQEAAAARAAEARAAEQAAATRDSVRDAIRRAGSWQQLRALLASVPDYLGPAELTVMLSRLPGLLRASQGGLTWRQRAELSALLEQWGGLMVERLGEDGCEARDIVTCLAALAELGWLQDARLLGALLREARSQLPRFESLDQMRALAAALVAARVRPSNAWLQAFAEATADRLAGAPAEQARGLAELFAQLGVNPGATWLLAYLGAVQAQEATLSADDALACVRAAAALDRPLTQRWLLGLQESRRAEEQRRRLQQQEQQPQQQAGTAEAEPALEEGSPAVQAAAPGLSSLSGEDSSDVWRVEAGLDEAGGLDVQDALEANDAQGAGATPRDASVDAYHEAGTEQLEEQLAPARPATQSLDFDEEQPAPHDSWAPPDTFLLEQMRPQQEASEGQDEGQEAEEGTGLSSQDGGTVSVTETDTSPSPEPPLSPAQRRALRAALLERLELLEEMQRTVQGSIAAAEARADAAAVQAAAVGSQLRVLQADYDRVRTRHEAEKLDVTSKVRLDVLKTLLPVLDNFDRAAASIKPATSGEAAIQAAYQSVPEQIQELLRSAGVEEVPGEGAAFDPAVHDAIMQAPDATVPDGTVLQVLQKGYRDQAGQLVRPALVKVSTAP